MSDLNIYKKCFIEFIEKLYGKSFQDNDWSVDFNIDLNQEFESEMKKLHAYFELSEAALRQQDYITAQVAFLYIKIHALNLFGFFQNIYDDLDSLPNSEGQLFSIPENFIIPEHYNFDNKMRNFAT